MPTISRIEVEQIVFEAIRNVNQARTAENQLPVGSEAPLFGPGSPLDSLGLVALLIDIEEAFADRGLPVTLNDDRAMSQHRNPFATVSALVNQIGTLLTDRA